MNLYRIVLSGLAVMIFTMTADAQLRIIPKEKIDNVTNPRLSADSAYMDFDTRHIVAEPMNEDDPPSTYVFSFTNVGDHTLKIERLISSCSCASASADRTEVRPGEKAVISVRYDPEGHPGKFERRIFVYTSSGNDPAAVLKLTVEVENGADLAGLWPVQIGYIRLRRSEVAFVSGQKAVEKLRFLNLSGKSLRLRCEEAFLPACLTFRTEPEVVEDGQEGEIVISYDPEQPERHNVMKVILKGLGISPSRSTLTVKLEP